MGNWGYREIFKFDGPNLKQLNDTLRALWTKVMGGIDMKDLDNATREVINNKVGAEVVNELGEVVSQHSTQIMQTATDLKALAESIEKVDEAVLKEMEDGSAAFIAGYSYALVSEFVLSEIGAAAGDEITWSVHVTPERSVWMGLLVEYKDGGGTGSSKWGKLSNVPAEGMDLTFTTTAPADAEKIALLFYLNSPESTKLTIAYRDSVLTKKGSQEYVTRAEFEMTSKEISLKVEEKLDAGDPAAGVDNSAGVIINANGVYVTGGEVALSTNDGSQFVHITGGGVSASSMSAPDVMPRYAGADEITVDPNATDAQVKAGTHVRSLQSAASLVNGRYLDYDVTIACASGAVEYGDIKISGICGRGILTIGKPKGVKPVLYGSMVIENCAAGVKLYEMIMHTASGTALIIGQNAGMVHVYGCEIRSANAYALVVEAGGRVYVDESVLSGRDSTTIAEDEASGVRARAAYVAEGGIGTFVDTTGKGDLYCKCGFMTASGSIPSGEAVWEDTFEPNNKNSLTASGTNSGSSAVATGTKEYEMIGSDSYAGGWGAFNDDDPRQGMCILDGVARPVRGCIWFNTGKMQEELGGKTIRQATLRLHRRTDLGRDSDVEVTLCGTSKAYGTSLTGTPAETINYSVIGMAKRGQSVELTIPTKVIEDLLSGAIKGLMLYNGEIKEYKNYGHSEHFAGFSTKDGEQPMLTVVYS